jgi:hypothetical protein
MTHLTLTGYYAGTPLCDVNKSDAKERGDKFYHATYAPNFVFEPDSDLCPQCRAEWDAAADDETDETGVSL